jgi:mannose-6-phosphate isomerase
VYPGDTGILAPLYLNIIDLVPGEALYLPAGIMHAYVRGTGLELMANSDNVLRCGLTSKHIDVQELLSIVFPSTFVPEIIRPDPAKSFSRYFTGSPEFELESIQLHDKTLEFVADFPGILLGGTGTITVRSGGGDSCVCNKGTSIFIAGTGEKLFFSGKGTCFLATIPQTPDAP